MAKVITKEDVVAASEKAAAKATAAETKRCVAAVKSSTATLLEGEVSKDYKAGIKAAVQAIVAGIKA